MKYKILKLDFTAFVDKPKEGKSVNELLNKEVEEGWKPMSIAVYGQSDLYPSLFVLLENKK